LGRSLRAVDLHAGVPDPIGGEWQGGLGVEPPVRTVLPEGPPVPTGVLASLSARQKWVRSLARSTPSG